MLYYKIIILRMHFMQVKNKVYCHWDLVRFVLEKQLQKDDGTFLTLSVIEGEKL